MAFIDFFHSADLAVAFQFKHRVCAVALRHILSYRWMEQTTNAAHARLTWLMIVSHLLSIPFRLFVLIHSRQINGIFQGINRNHTYAARARSHTKTHPTPIYSKPIINWIFWCVWIDMEHLRWHWMSIKCLQNHSKITNERSQSKRSFQSHFVCVLMKWAEMNRLIFPIINTKIRGNFEEIN